MITRLLSGKYIKKVICIYCVDSSSGWSGIDYGEALQATLIFATIFHSRPPVGLHGPLFETMLYYTIISMFYKSA